MTKSEVSRVVADQTSRHKPAHARITGSYWLLFAYCLGASTLVRLYAPSLPAVVWLSCSGVILADVLISWGAESVFPNQLPPLGRDARYNTRLLTSLVFGTLRGPELVKHRRDIHLNSDLRFVSRIIRPGGPAEQEAA